MGKRPQLSNKVCGPRSGFALLITITLLAFLVLLLVSLASLTRVETQVAANGQLVAQARQHALLGLSVALGQLQRHAGPDARVTATAEALSSATVANPNLTGVWTSSGGGSAATSWMVIGSESSGTAAAVVLANTPDPRDDTVSADQVFLVGNTTVAADVTAPTATEKAGRIKVTKRDIYAPAGATPGLDAAASPKIGRYAWWVGDQGVKASLALADRADEVTYAPWNTQTQRRRIRQQIASMPNYFRAGNATTAYTKAGFDPITVGALLGRVATSGQFAMITPVAGTMPEFARTHWHDFTPVARAVLANTRTDAHAGLMRDLSLAPAELGAAFAAYADYAGYMETPGQTLSGAPAAVPAIDDADSPRRRYRLTPSVTSSASDPVSGLVFGVSPVIAEMVLQFSVEYMSGGEYRVGTKIYLGLWNPYTSALVVPDDLAVVVSGLPTINVINRARTESKQVDLQADVPAEIRDGAAGGMRFDLRFDAGAQADHNSWLPGRIYGWTSKKVADLAAATSAESRILRFYNKNTNTTDSGRWYYTRGPITGASTGIGAVVPSVEKLSIRLENSSGILASYTTPSFGGFEIPSDTSGTKWFAYAIRLKQPWAGSTDRTWLKTYDPHDVVLPSTAWDAFDPTRGLDPAQYSSYQVDTALPGSLIYRIQGASSPALSSYNDAPLFELPRLPLLSVGELQHMAISGRRAYYLGNSWAGADNALFDRFFLSGLPAAGAGGAPDLASGQPLPNWNLQPTDAGNVATIQAAGALSSRYLLQAGGFNINSVSVAAWRAILSGVRFGNAFVAADIETSAASPAVGTQKTSTSVVSEKFDADATLGAGTASPTFFRFPQSAQETYFWKPVVSSLADARQFPTHAFRLGVRGSNDSSAAGSTVDASVTAQRLTADQIESLATEIVSRIKSHAAANGPFRTLEEFLGPASGADTPSLMEAAIDAAGLNPDEIKPLDNVSLSGGVYGAGLSSLTLTQADILTALAPYLRARSDTFMIRTYGETLNPITGETAGKAWLEASVQRFPETVDPADDIARPTGAFGRRFKIVSFRWLSPADI